MSKQPLPFGEAKSCNDLECTFCPCGATRFSLHGATLRVNGREVTLTLTLTLTLNLTLTLTLTLTITWCTGCS